MKALRFDKYSPPAALAVRLAVQAWSRFISAPVSAVTPDARVDTSA
jgi:hypothetical protein